MKPASSLVLKLQHGDKIKRFSKSPEDLETLRNLAKTTFHELQESDVTLRYIDEDREEVYLSEEDDLQNAYEVAHEYLSGTLKVIVTEKKNGEE